MCMPMSQALDLPPKQRAALKKQLALINARLLSLERERHELKNAIARLHALLQRPTMPPAGARCRALPQLTGARAPHSAR